MDKRRKILEPTEPSTVGREKIRDAVDTVKRRKGAAKIAITKATAREIRDSLGITPADVNKAMRAIESARTNKKEAMPKRTIKPAAGKSSITADQARKAARKITKRKATKAKRRRVVSRPLPEFPIVYVEWVDHTGSEGWCSLAELRHHNEDEYLAETIGWLVAENRSRITVAATLTVPNENKPERDASGYMTIDRKLIRRFRKLSHAALGGERKRTTA